jgi:hypothetical protein
MHQGYTIVSVYTVQESRRKETPAVGSRFLSSRFLNCIHGHDGIQFRNLEERKRLPLEAVARAMMTAVVEDTSGMTAISKCSFELFVQKVRLPIKIPFVVPRDSIYIYQSLDMDVSVYIPLLL